MANLAVDLNQTYANVGNVCWHTDTVREVKTRNENYVQQKSSVKGKCKSKLFSNFGNNRNEIALSPREVPGKLPSSESKPIQCLPDNTGSSSSSQNNNSSCGSRNDSESSNDSLAVVDESESEDDSCYSSKPGWVFFFNCIKNCNDDVAILKEKFSSLGYECRDMEVNSINDFDRALENQNVGSESIIVFFYGYGYGENMYLGPSTSESVSYEMFYMKMSKFRKDGTALVLFSNTCWKNKATDTTEHSEYDELTSDVFHFCTEVQGTCENGSLMTKCLLHDMRPKKMDFNIFSRELSMKINNPGTWHGDIYYSYIKFHGVIDDIKLPSLKVNRSY